MINKHGLRMNGLKAVAGNTKAFAKDYDPSTSHYDIYYDLKTGEVTSKLICTRDEYRAWMNKRGHVDHVDPELMKVASVNYPLTMQEIADMIYDEWRTE